MSDINESVLLIRETRGTTTTGGHKSSNINPFTAKEFLLLLQIPRKNGLEVKLRQPEIFVVRTLLCIK